MTRIKSLRKARESKYDEFYTRYEDIEEELQYYHSHLKDKTIYCNCDNVQNSNFAKYFIDNFHKLQIRKLIVTGLQNPSNSRDLFWIPTTEFATILEKNGFSRIKLMGDPEYPPGDFRSRECMNYLKESDIVITNPPFSLYREFIKLLITHNKLFLIIIFTSATSYIDTFNLIKNHKAWCGINYHSTTLFHTPQGNPDDPKYKLINNQYFMKCQNCWLTNMGDPKKRPFLKLTQSYNPDKYVKYDNYDAIEIPTIKDIPRDYHGNMGVPTTFLPQYNPLQFEIIGLFNSGYNQLKSRSLKITIGEKRITYNGPIINGKAKFIRIIIKHR